MKLQIKRYRSPLPLNSYSQRLNRIKSVKINDYINLSQRDCEDKDTSLRVNIRLIACDKSPDLDYTGEQVENVRYRSIIYNEYRPSKTTEGTPWKVFDDK